MPQKASLKGSNVSASAFYVEGRANEDRFQIYTDSHSNQPNGPTQFGFGVHDGHGGKFGSDLCADRLCDDVWNDFNAMKSNIVETKASICYDALLCASMRKVAKALNRRIKKESRTGTTAVTLFIRRTDTGTHVYCANIGDSRCVAKINNTRFAMSKDHNVKCEFEFKRIENHIPATWFPLPIQIKVDPSTGISKIVPSVEEMEIATTFITSLPSSSSIDPSLTPEPSVHLSAIPSLRMAAVENIAADDSSVNSVTIPQIAEPGIKGVDHDIETTVHGEKSGANSTTNSVLDSVPAIPLPRRSLEGDESTYSETPRLKANLSVGSDLDLTAHGDTTTSAVTPTSATPVIIFNSDVMPPDKESSVPIMVFDTQLDDDTEFISMPILHQKSFIGKRVTEDKSQVGPLALFSRHGVSITMTRSLGDRHAARTCVCTPDITKVIVSDSEYARFILASDGLWDVISNEMAFKLTARITDPEEASVLLCNKAREIRKAKNIRMDDISCIIVDVNPSLNMTVAPSTACAPGCVMF